MSEDISSEHYLDLCGFVCPVNFVKCCIALENFGCANMNLRNDETTFECAHSELLLVILDRGCKET